eukprot:TRINITY_DN3133_c0_g2_i1.p1 TRINITY_DN3133_c0_g2~~TRINITY_DN3133_c0_g2_i1.p1  ORF type:complete len:221 (-),score=57.87 TRINITY_DN3133_c0_g2_i1:366-1028(-)
MNFQPATYGFNMQNQPMNMMGQQQYYDQQQQAFNQMRQRFDPNQFMINIFGSSQPQEMMMLQQKFSMIDVDGSGEIEVPEIIQAFSTPYSQFSEESARMLIRIFDTDNGTINFNEFILMDRFITRIRSVYTQFDPTGMGIQASMLGQALATVGFVVSPLTCQNLIRVFCRNNMMTVDYLTFVNICIMTCLVQSLHARFSNGQPKALLSKEDLMSVAMFLK